jgi:hypothetical protein
MPAEPALLCESCGYPIHGLPETGNCPECGRAIASSLPSARTGSAWQRRPGLTSLLTTGIDTLRRPRATFDSLIIEFRCGSPLLAAYLLLAGLAVVAPWYGTLIGDPARSARLAHRNELLTALWAVPLQVLAVAALLLALTLIEWLGVQFWSRRRGLRLLPAAAWQICAHASIGWVLMAGLMMTGMLVWPLAQALGLGFLVAHTIGSAILFVPPGLGILAGLLVFETLVYTGVQRCRFANPPRRNAAPA